MFRQAMVEENEALKEWKQSEQWKAGADGVRGRRTGGEEERAMPEKADGGRRVPALGSVTPFATAVRVHLNYFNS